MKKKIREEYKYLQFWHHQANKLSCILEIVSTNILKIALIVGFQTFQLKKMPIKEFLYTNKQFISITCLFILSRKLIL